MTGHQLCEAACDGDTAKLNTLMCAQGAQSFINYQDTEGFTVLHESAQKGLETVTEQLLVPRCNVNLQSKNGGTPIHVVVGNGHF